MNRKEIAYILGIAAAGVLLNMIITATPLVEISTEYQEANEILYAGSISQKILRNCIIAPFVEELIYRFMIFWIVDKFLPGKPVVQIILSSIAFALLHGNIVQMLYALLMGALLGAAYADTKKLRVPLIAHSLTNFIVIIATTYIF